MKEITPNYYQKFKCIASKCNHNCCIGWEIDIDCETLEKYKNAEGIIKTQYNQDISEADGAHFILTENERCPFLNKNNLCDIIENYGEDMLCQVCNDHPRFRNFFSKRTEMGLGLCCEAAGKLILEFKDKAVIDNNYVGTDEELAFFRLREHIFNVLQSRDKAIDTRINKILDIFGVALNTTDVYNKYKGLERLDSEWDFYLERLRKYEDLVLPSKWDLPFEQFAVYLVFRHLGDAVHDGRINERIRFIAESYNTVKTIFLNGERSIEELIEIVRLFSSEIEYSDENLELLLR